MPSPTGELGKGRVPLGRSAPVGRLGLRSCSSAVHVRDLSARLSRAFSTNRAPVASREPVFVVKADALAFYRASYSRDARIR